VYLQAMERKIVLNYKFPWGSDPLK